MNLKQWLQLNPNHRVTLGSAPGDKVRAVLKNGEGVDQRLVGEGDDEVLAIKHALDNRDSIKASLP